MKFHSPAAFTFEFIAMGKTPASLIEILRAQQVNIKVENIYLIQLNLYGSFTFSVFKNNEVILTL